MSGKITVGELTKCTETESVYYGGGGGLGPAVRAGVAYEKRITKRLRSLYPKEFRSNIHYEYEDSTLREIWDRLCAIKLTEMSDKDKKIYKKMRGPRGIKIIDGLLELPNGELLVIEIKRTLRDGRDHNELYANGYPKLVEWVEQKKTKKLFIVNFVKDVPEGFEKVNGSLRTLMKMNLPEYAYLVSPLDE